MCIPGPVEDTKVSPCEWKARQEHGEIKSRNSCHRLLRVRWKADCVTWSETAGERYLMREVWKGLEGKNEIQHEGT